MDGEPESVEVMVKLLDDEEPYKAYYHYDEKHWYVHFGGITVGHRKIDDRDDIEGWYYDTALPLAQPVQPEDVSNLQKIEYWTKQYEFSFQFWGEGNNNVFINRGYVEIASFGGGDSINEILEDTIAWCEKANPRFNYSK